MCPKKGRLCHCLTKKKIHEIDFPNKMIKNCRSARSAYFVDLEN